MRVGSVLVSLLLLFFQSNENALACVEPVRFEDTPEYALLDSIEAKSRTKKALLSKLAAVSDLGEAIRSYKNFVSKGEYNDFKDINRVIRRWADGESVVAQHLLSSFLFLKIDDIVKHDYAALIEKFLKENKKFCWLESDNFYFKFINYKLRAAQVYPEELELKEIVFFIRESLWHSGDVSYLQDYFDLLRVGGIDLAKEELKIWSRENASDDFCNNVAHCIERIRIEFEYAKENNSKTIEQKVRNFECDGRIVDSSGATVAIDFCDGILANLKRHE